jgi:hypothetical protein
MAGATEAACGVVDGVMTARGTVAVVEVVVAEPEGVRFSVGMAGEEDEVVVVAAEIDAGAISGGCDAAVPAGGDNSTVAAIGGDAKWVAPCMAVVWDNAARG